MRVQTPTKPVKITSEVNQQYSWSVNMSAPRTEVISAIERAADGEMLWTREELRRVSSSLAAPRSNGDMEFVLSTRESAILKLVADGATNKDIANSLNLSYETIKENV